ncbi:MAG: DUF4160 domain-containing protein [Verrucomicrobia bacterium]|nr:DUF4160 domain-containing protein [Verrucomicrobiota bacterium]
MPTVLRVGPYRFHFYSRENNEPPHVHVSRDDCECKFWLSSDGLAKNYGFSASELNRIAVMVRENKDALLSAWSQFHE